MRINISVPDSLVPRIKALCWFEGKTFSRLVQDLSRDEILSVSDSLNHFDDTILKRYKVDVLGYE